VLLRLISHCCAHPCRIDNPSLGFGAQFTACLICTFVLPFLHFRLRSALPTCLHDLETAYKHLLKLPSPSAPLPSVTA
jgi:hypothetical protein